MNEELKKLYEENVINYEQYQQAISINDEENWKRRLQNAIVVLSGINNMLSSVSSYAQACADAETAKIQAEYDKQIEAAKNNSSKREKLEEERDEKIRKAKNAANRRAMPIQIAQALATTAMNALAAYGAVLQPLQPHTYPLAYAAAAAATAAGMLQVETIKNSRRHRVPVITRVVLPEVITIAVKPASSTKANLLQIIKLSTTPPSVLLCNSLTWLSVIILSAA